MIWLGASRPNLALSATVIGTLVKAIYKPRNICYRNRNRKLLISRAPTKAKSQEPAYSQALNQNHKIIDLGVISALQISVNYASKEYLFRLNKNRFYKFLRISLV